MLANDRWGADTTQLDYAQQCLPQMTAFFLDGLSVYNTKKDSPDSNIGSDQGADLLNRRFRVPVSSSGGITTKEVMSFCSRIAKPQCRSRMGMSDGEVDDMRQIICGISNCFNNILMGVWGNISLLSLSVEQSHPIMKPVHNIDRLIHNGSLLIHALFGYLAERRLATRHLRLIQLTQEINARYQHQGVEFDIEKIEKRLELAFLKTRPRAVAGSLAHVLDQLLCWIDRELQRAKLHPTKKLMVRKRLKIIDRVFARGVGFVRQLQLYAGDIPPVRQRIDIKAMVRRQVQLCRKRFKRVKVAVEVSDALRSLKGDRNQLDFVMEELVANAVAAMPNGGKILIAARPISEENPKERCVIDQARDYNVITVSDNGFGMSTRIQSKIFYPFFVGQRKSSPVGLGLAASASIVKKHGGYIQVKSINGKGSTFKIYLPIAHNTVNNLSSNKRAVTV